jgi:hypothetical protein
MADGGPILKKAAAFRWVTLPEKPLASAISTMMRRLDLRRSLHIKSM